MSKAKKKNIYAEIISKALKDEDFKKKLKKKPEETIKKDFGIEIPAGVKIKVIEDSDVLRHLVIPSIIEDEARELSDAELETVAAAGAPHTGQPTLMCDTAWQTCWVCNP